ncbi:hypothetical protein ABH931_003124 [Streptacidiphilus sp. MAP12-33]|uniref:DUF7848 domain-containing protein n=1 Tax=Streptacidiphilus sp. MAP12-33 TaxID=3156266 RepID=UPI003514231F
MGTTTRYRFRDYKVTAVPDALGLPTLGAVCVTGESADCGARSEDVTDPGALVRWIAEHCAATGHETYEHHTTVTVQAEPGAWH